MLLTNKVGSEGMVNHIFEKVRTYDTKGRQL